MQHNRSNGNKVKLIIAGGIVAVVVAGTLFISGIKGNNSGNANQSSKAAAQISENGDLVIPVKDITEKANFYAYKSEDGTKLEVLAVKASDGTIRTAFNTCQVCYSSGKGYYEMKGDILECQNCGNRFSADDVEVTRGGCNPVPITDEYKTVDEANITLSKDFLEKAKVIFENWKS